MAEKGLRMMAYQDIKGIPLPERVDLHFQKQNSEGGRKMGSMKDVAGALFCSPGHLSRLARERGYSYSKAVRWIRFLLGAYLLRQSRSSKAVAWRLGFADSASWCRFTKRLVGKTPKQLPKLPLEDWAREAVFQVFLAPLRRRE